MKTRDDGLFNWAIALSALDRLPSLHRTGLASSFLCTCLRDGGMTDDLVQNFSHLMQLVDRSRSGELLAVVIEAVGSDSESPLPDDALACLIDAFNLVDDRQSLIINFRSILGFVRDRPLSKRMEFLTYVSDAKYVSLFIKGHGQVMGDYLHIVTSCIHSDPSLCELFHHPFLFASMERCYIGDKSSFFARTQWLRFCHALLFRSDFPFVNLIWSEGMRMIRRMRAFITHEEEEEEQYEEPETLPDYDPEQEEQHEERGTLPDHDPEEEGHLEYCVHIISLMLDRSAKQDERLRVSIIDRLKQSAKMLLVINGVAQSECWLRIENCDEVIDLAQVARAIVTEITPVLGPGW
jgi:hypothetical protein